MKTAMAIGLAAFLLPLAVAVRPVSARSNDPDWTIGVDAAAWRLPGTTASVPLVSTAPLDAPGAVVVLGGRDIGGGTRPGFQLTIGRGVGAR